MEDVESVEEIENIEENFDESTEKKIEEKEKSSKEELGQIEEPNEKNEFFNVVARIRPIQPKEKGKRSIINILNDKSFEINYRDDVVYCELDKVFPPTSTQIEVYKYFQNCIELFLKGINITFLAYGHTGSGKTHSMFGEDWESAIGGPAEYNNTLNEKKTKKTNVHSKKIDKQQHTIVPDNIQNDINRVGVIPRMIDTLMEENYDDIMENDLSIYVSFLQIYNEKVFDLLQDKQIPLEIHETPLTGIYVESLTEFHVQTQEEILYLQQRGEKSRLIRETKMNAKSSRSHIIFQIRMENKINSKPGESGIKAKMCQCDLAGSEKMGDDIGSHKDTHFKELKHINLSQTNLGKVIYNLSNNIKLPIPYRDSKLTRLLQESLSGAGKTYFMANLASIGDFVEETMMTQKFAQRARNVKTSIVPNKIVNTDDKVVKQLRGEIKYQKEVLNLNKRTGGMSELVYKMKELKYENEKLRGGNMEDINKIKDENKKQKLEVIRLRQQQQQKDLELVSGSNMRMSLNNKFESNSNKEIVDKLNLSGHTRNYTSIEVRSDLKSKSRDNTDHNSQDETIIQFKKLETQSDIMVISDKFHGNKSEKAHSTPNKSHTNYQKSGSEGGDLTNGLNNATKKINKKSAKNIFGLKSKFTSSNNVSRSQNADRDLELQKTLRQVNNNHNRSLISPEMGSLKGPSNQSKKLTQITKKSDPKSYLTNLDSTNLPGDIMNHQNQRNKITVLANKFDSTPNIKATHPTDSIGHNPTPKNENKEYIQKKYNSPTSSTMVNPKNYFDKIDMFYKAPRSNTNQNNSSVHLINNGSHKMMPSDCLAGGNHGNKSNFIKKDYSGTSLPRQNQVNRQSSSKIKQFDRQMKLLRDELNKFDRIKKGIQKIESVLL